MAQPSAGERGRKLDARAIGVAKKPVAKQKAFGVVEKQAVSRLVAHILNHKNAGHDEKADLAATTLARLLRAHGVNIQ